MLTIAELKRIHFLAELEDGMLEAFAPMVEAREYARDKVVFKEGDPADYLYMLGHGKILLNMVASEKVSVSVTAVDPGDTFGWSAILGRSHYSASAVCVESSTVWSVRSRDLVELFHQDFEMGFRVMEHVARALNDRLEKRTTQLFKTLLEHINMVCGLDQAV
ncbi:MAG: Crp/Fnr family transcriptional regulator [Desulfatibacillaceae bacterium]